MEKGNKPATVKDVAKLANVAPSTVSLVINDSKKVKPLTKQKVLEAIEELHYVPNPYASSLRQQYTMSIGILVPDGNNPFYLEIIKGIKEECFHNNIPITVLETGYVIEKEQSHIEYLRSIKTNVYIFIGTTNDDELIRELVKNNKICFIDKVDHTGKIPYITIDSYKSSYHATKYLVNKGCKEIHYITQNIMTDQISQRIEAFKEVLAEKNIESVDKIHIIDNLALTNLEIGHFMANSVLKTHKVEAFMASSDQIAIGVMRAIHEAGYRIPEDISVIGFDNIEQSNYTIPSLTTINQPRKQMGKLAMSMLLNDKFICDKNNNSFIVKFDFIVRESVKS